MSIYVSRVLKKMKLNKPQRLRAPPRVAVRCRPERAGLFLEALSIFFCVTRPLGFHKTALQWGAADAEIKVPSGENAELERSPFKAWSRSVYSHTFHAYCQVFLPCFFLPYQSIHLHFFQNLYRFLLCWLWLTHDSCVGPQNKIDHPARRRFPC